MFEKLSAMDNDLKNNPCTVRCFINDKELFCKYFTDRQERKDWMNLITESMKGNSFYFQLEYQYPKLNKSEIIEGYELNPLLDAVKAKTPIPTKLKEYPEKTKEEIASFRKSLAVYSNRQYL